MKYPMLIVSALILTSVCAGDAGAVVRSATREDILNIMLTNEDDPQAFSGCIKTYLARFGREDFETNLLAVIRGTRGINASENRSFGTWRRADAISALQCCGSTNSYPLLTGLINDRRGGWAIVRNALDTFIAIGRFDEPSLKAAECLYRMTNSCVSAETVCFVLMDQCRRQNPPPATTNRLVAFFTAARATEERFPHRVDAALCELSPAYRRSPERAQYVRECLAKGPSTGSAHDYFKKAEAELGAALTNHVGQAVSGPGRSRP